MKIRIFLAAVIAVLAAGCTTASGPMHNLDVVTLPDEGQGWRVQCQGAFESSKVCVDEAHKVCGDQPVRVINSIDRPVAGYKPKDDPREIVFACGAPVQQVAQQSVQAEVSTPVAVHKMLLQGDANFNTGSAALTSIARQRLDQFIEGNRGAALGHVSIYGHTDATGTVRGNQRLSNDRSIAVQNYLMQHGAHATSYSVHGYGSSMPVASNATADGRAMNRRVEIQVDGQ